MVLLDHLNNLLCFSNNLMLTMPQSAQSFVLSNHSTKYTVAIPCVSYIKKREQVHPDQHASTSFRHVVQPKRVHSNVCSAG